MRNILFVIVAFFGSVATAQDLQWSSVPFRMELAPDVRAYYRNPDGSCVQCSIGMCGMWTNNPNAYSLLWDSEYGPAVRGGSWPSRVEQYAIARGLKIYNVTGETTWQWMEWAARTGRFAAIGAGQAHFQTLAGFDPKSREWFVCNNNSPTRIDRYSEAQFRRLHLASGQWCVILNDAPPPVNPQYIQWWQ